MSTVAKKTAVKTTSLSEMEDRLIGKKGTAKRDQYEQNLKVEMLGETLKSIRLQKRLTQAQLGSRIGVNKAQVSKLEASMGNASIKTVIRAFRALNSDILFGISPSKTKKVASKPTH